MNVNIDDIKFNSDVPDSLKHLPDLQKNLEWGKLVLLLDANGEILVCLPDELQSQDDVESLFRGQTVNITPSKTHLEEEAARIYSVGKQKEKKVSVRDEIKLLKEQVRILQDQVQNLKDQIDPIKIEENEVVL